MEGIVWKLYPEKDDVMQWHMQAGNITTYIIIMGQPPWPYSLIIIGWWYSILEQQLQGHYTMSLFMISCQFSLPQ